MMTEFSPRSSGRATPRVLRAATWLAGVACMTVVGLGLLAYRARAWVDELAGSTGADLLRYAGADQEDARRTLVINGLRVHVGSGGTHDAPGEILDQFHARCRTRGIAFDAPLSASAAAARFPFARALPLDGVLRVDDGERGYVACLDLGGRHLSPDELLQRARDFVADGDLAHFGELRFAIVERHGARTQYLALWSEGAFPLVGAFPPVGDAPGKDPAGVPRVPGARRVLSAWQSDAAPSLAVYRADAIGVPALELRYRRALEGAGFRVHAAAPDHRGLVAARGDDWFLVAFAADGADALASVTPL